MHDDPLERLTTLVRKERAGLVSLARREGMQPEEALECVQEALCTFLARERAGATVTTYEHALRSVKVMVRNEARNLRRRHHRKQPHRALEPDADLLVDGADALELLVHAEDVVRLRLCVSELCGVKRAVVMLRLLDERSGEDVAALLGLERGHVDVLVHRARAALRVCMRESLA
jgi:RNA polymerase sigma-70 factor (ECF subfamily)